MSPQDVANIQKFHDRHHDPIIRQSADDRLRAASNRLNDTHPILHPIQFARARKERDAAVMHAREFGSGARYQAPPVM